MTIEGTPLPGRSVTLVLCTPDGRVLGALPAFDVPTPWWQDVADVTAAARSRLGVDVVVLRLLEVRTRTVVEGGPVTYLAEVPRAPDVPLDPAPRGLGDPAADEPLRAAYARPGGPAADLAWACGVLSGVGLRLVGAPQQLRTWNLSAIWCLPTVDGPVWLKCVPPFFAHEGPVLDLLGGLAPEAVPPLLGWAGGRMLLGDVPGEDQYHARGTPLGHMVRLLVGIQVAMASRTQDLFSLGSPDWRVAALGPQAQSLVGRAGGELAAAERRALDALVESLPERSADLNGCGLPDTLVHGDFHPGNVRGTSQRLVLLDWGDCGVGHPLVDQLAFCERLGSHDRAQVLRLWAAMWSKAVPGCDPVRAARLLRPVAALRSAVVYQRFLDSIEPSERAYHADDPTGWLRRAAALGLAE